SHCIMKKQGSIFRIVIPQHRELRPGIIHQIMKEADLSIEQITKYL
ncbi:MAG: type II toxin-antitoxin system HicA family toxin, partial [Methanospirillum sp.]|nr:type II toxin-antitoxin system HicA family toxin [Methanospirillum sp.]